MNGEKNLNKLLKNMTPKLLKEEFVFTSIPSAKYGQYIHFHPLASFMEEEGLTLIIPKKEADDNELNYESTYRCITLTIHSSLDAVGLTAKVSAKLADHEISANVVAAYYHDHIFVQTEKAESAINALREFAD